MKNPAGRFLFIMIALGCIGVLNPNPAAATQGNTQKRPTVWKENTDGMIRPDEYRKISENGALTRRPCPYTCEMRGIPNNHCRTWRSIVEPDQCYVWDTRYHQSAVPIK